MARHQAYGECLFAMVRTRNGRRGARKRPPNGRGADGLAVPEKAGRTKRKARLRRTTRQRRPLSQRQLRDLTRRSTPLTSQTEWVARRRRLTRALLATPSLEPPRRCAGPRAAAHLRSGGPTLSDQLIQHLSAPHLFAETTPCNVWPPKFHATAHRVHTKRTQEAKARALEHKTAGNAAFAAGK